MLEESNSSSNSSSSSSNSSSSIVVVSGIRRLPSDPAVRGPSKRTEYCILLCSLALDSILMVKDVLWIPVTKFYNNFAKNYKPIPPDFRVAAASGLFSTPLVVVTIITLKVQIVRITSYNTVRHVTTKWVARPFRMLFVCRFLYSTYCDITVS